MLGLLALVLIFHRPIIFGVARSLINRNVAKENLRVDFAFEGSIFTSLAIRNLHVTPTGPTIVESIDVDYLRADYSLWDWMRRGPSELLKSAELLTARVVLDPAKASLKPKLPPPDEPLRLFPIFPERLVISDANVLVRSTTEKPDFVLEHFTVELDPKHPGELRAAVLQIPNADAWRDISAKTSYTTKNLVISGLALDQQTQFRWQAVDAPPLAARPLEGGLRSSR